MPSEQVQSRFLYTILKQVDLKHVGMFVVPHLTLQIDWAAVAHEMNISNGHAARMRYSRFRQSQEGRSHSRSSSNASAVSRTRARTINTEHKESADSSEPLKIENHELGNALQWDNGNENASWENSTLDMHSHENCIACYSYQMGFQVPQRPAEPLFNAPFELTDLDEYTHNGE